jgi:hypothetical protein
LSAIILDLYYLGLTDRWLKGLLRCDFKSQRTWNYFFSIFSFFFSTLSPPASFLRQ